MPCRRARGSARCFGHRLRRHQHGSIRRSTAHDGTHALRRDGRDCCTQSLVVDRRASPARHDRASAPACRSTLGRGLQADHVQQFRWNTRRADALLAYRVARLRRYAKLRGARMAHRGHREVAQHTIVIKDATVVTVDRDDTIHYDAAVAIEDGRIAAVGPSREIVARFPGAHAVDGSRQGGDAGLRQHPHPFHPDHRQAASTRTCRRRTSRRSPAGCRRCRCRSSRRDEMIAMVRLAALEAIRSGTTAVLEDGSNVENYAQGIADTGLRLLLCEKAWDKAKGNIGDPGPFEVDAALGDECIAQTSRRCTRSGTARATAASRRRVRLGARHVLARAAAQAARPAATSSIRSRPSISTRSGARSRRSKAHPQPHADRISRRYRLPERSPDLRPLPLHGAAEEERLLGEARTNVAFNACHRGAPRPQPAHRTISRSYGCNIAMGTDNMAEDMVEVMRTGMFMERVRREDGRAADARAGDALGDASTAIARWAFPMAAALEPATRPI